MIKLYRKDEVPEDLKGRGLWLNYGNETLFRPFSGDAKLINPTNWKCEFCGLEWYIGQIIENEYHCLQCGKWAGLLNKKR